IQPKRGIKGRTGTNDTEVGADNAVDLPGSAQTARDAVVTDDDGVVHDTVDIEDAGEIAQLAAALDATGRSQLGISRDCELRSVGHGPLQVKDRGNAARGVRADDDGISTADQE